VHRFLRRLCERGWPGDTERQADLMQTLASVTLRPDLEAQPAGKGSLQRATHAQVEMWRVDSLREADRRHAAVTQPRVAAAQLIAAEETPREAISRRPQHAHTRALGVLAIGPLLGRLPEVERVVVEFDPRDDLRQCRRCDNRSDE
jgi:sRNA-binding protein